MWKYIPTCTGKPIAIVDFQGNRLTIRPLLVQYGLWDQIRVDQGKEWVLMLYIQETLSHLRRNTDRAPHLQSTSKQVHICLLALKPAQNLMNACLHNTWRH